MSTNLIVKPDIEFSILEAVEDSIFEEQRVLMVGQMLPGSIATENVLIENFTTVDDALFGARSVLTQMILAFKRINSETRLDVLPLEDGGGSVKASGSLVFTGTATRGGSFDVAIGSETTARVTISVTLGDTAAVIALAVTTAFATLSNAPITIDSSAAGTAAFSAANAGTVGNFIGIDVFGFIQGISVVINAFTGGTGSPAAPDFTTIDGLRYQTIVFGTELNISDLETLVNDRFNVDNTVLDGIGIFTIQDTVSAIATAGNGFDSQSLSIIANPINTALTHGFIFELSDVISAQFGASRALRLTLGSNITKLLSGRNNGDTLGGPHMASRPYQNIPFPDLALIPIDEDLTQTQIKSLETSGLSLLGNNIARDSIVMSIARTTNKTIPTWKFLNTVDTASQVREYFFNNFNERYQQSRLTRGDLIDGRNMQNENSIKTFANELYNDLAKPEFNLTVAGEEALNTFKDNTTITLNLITGEFVILFQQVPIVTQVRKLETVVSIEFAVTQ